MAQRNASGSRTSKYKVRAADMVSRILDLKRSGMSIREIAAETDMCRSTVHRYIEQGIAGIPQATREALVSEVHERQLAVISAHWRTRHLPESAKIIQAGDKLMMNLLGLEAPKKQEITGKDGAPILAMTDEQLAEFIAQAGGASKG